MKIPEYSKTNPLAEETANPILKSVLEHDKHPSAFAVRNLNTRSHFEFSFVSVDEVLKMTAQSTSVLVKITAQKMKKSLMKNFIFCAVNFKR